MNARRWKCVCAYDGTNFAGWDQADDIVARVQARFSGDVRERILAGTALARFRRTT